MNLLFVGIKPTSELENTLLSQDFVPHFSAKYALGQDLNQTFDLDLIVAFVGKKLNTKGLSRLRNRYPKAWITLVVPSRWLKDSASLGELLRCGAKNEVLPVTIWENALWLSIHSALGHRAQHEQLAKLTTDYISLKKDYNDLTTRSNRLVKQLEHDVELASNIQKSLLPKISPEIPGVSLAIKYLPAAGLGGDYYDIFEFGDRKRFGVLIADAPTHGMAATLLSVLVKIRLEEMKDRFPDSRSFVEFLNHEIQQVSDKEKTSLSLLYGIIDRTSLTFQYTATGHLRPLLWRNGTTPTIPKSGNPALGENTLFNFNEHSIKLEPGDLLIFHTDGLDKPLGGNSSARITSLLKEKKLGSDPQEFQNEVMALVDAHVERQPLSDDITIIEMAVHHKTLYLASGG
jgi:serine phosphatase RsbU (regulator of sigma subunit)